MSAYAKNYAFVLERNENQKKIPQMTEKRMEERIKRIERYISKEANEKQQKN